MQAGRVEIGRGRSHLLYGAEAGQRASRVVISKLDADA
jgi:hypothetical protein